MKKNREFSALNVPLSGTQLIEASAGTGKTHTITDLFLRLIMEKGLTVDQILVVTFTEAATEELRDRIRKKLRHAINMFSPASKSAVEDNTIREISKTCTDRRAAVERLQLAVSSFDEAAIFTIHAFCLQVLQDLAFETAVPFDTELITSQEHLIQEAVDDFWRRHFYQASDLFVSCAVNSRFSPDMLLSLAVRHINNPFLKIIPESRPADTKEHEELFIESFDRVSRAWPGVKEEVTKLLMTHKSLNRNKYRSASIRKWISSLDNYLSAGEPSPVLPERFSKFTPEDLSDAAKENNPPEHPFFCLCEDLMKKSSDLNSLFQQRLIFLKASLFDHVKKELEQKKSEQNVQYFDDLLLKVSMALQGPDSEKLAEQIRHRFRAALIDEFQDTDPVQYEIFRRVFKHRDTLLILIGDPKQAIYSFRSADLFTYMEAAGSVKKPFTIDKNWRSEPELINALNVLFSHHKNPFLYDRIRYGKTEPSRSPKEELLIDQKKEPLLHFWFLRGDKAANRTPGKNRSDISLLIAGEVANEAARLLNKAAQNRVLIGDRALQTSDIAVLVRTHSQARLIQQELTRRSVPCILHSTGYVFKSDEALDLNRILIGISNPNNERLVRAALTTDIMGTTGEELFELLTDEREWETRLIAFRGYHDIWNRDGFFRMFRKFMSEEQVKQRIISLPRGERRLTNLLHLSEVLHRQSSEFNQGMRGLVKWFSEQINPAAPNLDEHMLRLESDEDAVKIVTVHKSKGLEYPVVFCPFAWTGPAAGEGETVFHDRDDNFRLKLDLGSPAHELHRQYAEEESLAENMRLLYVALTRAINRCYLVWGGLKAAGTSALSYLFHNRNPKNSLNIVRDTSD